MSRISRTTISLLILAFLTLLPTGSSGAQEDKTREHWTSRREKLLADHNRVDGVDSRKVTLTEPSR
jgi:hypothetical protein